MRGRNLFFAQKTVAQKGNAVPVSFLNELMWLRVGASVFRQQDS